MKILFIYSLNNCGTIKKPLNTPEQINFGISYIASVLKNEGHQVRLAVLSSDRGRKNFKIIKAIMTEFEPEIVGFSSIATEYPFILEVAEYFKNHYPEICRIAGGPHVSLNPHEVIKGPFDALCIGEGEYPFLEFVQQIEKVKELLCRYFLVMPTVIIRRSALDELEEWFDTHFDTVE